MKDEKNLTKEETSCMLIENGIKELVIRHGEAFPVREPVALKIGGNIDSVARFISNRKDEFEHNKAHIISDRAALMIVLTIDEPSYFSGIIQGNAEIDARFKEWGINTGKSWTTFELADFIRMRRAFFENVGTATELVTVLRNFKAKVNKELENNDDKRGNRDVVKRQVVESNVPAGFKVNLPIFKGFKVETIDVEIDIDADSLNCKLVSPHAAELQVYLTDSIIDEQLKAIALLAYDILIIEQ
ncbi:MAG: hypothetical protein Q8N05_16655 [Bacteroidota bacterium]|nr:hypothetical protein [Bacteroidota bacterium]